MKNPFPNNLGTNTKRGALIGAVALGLVALIAGGGIGAFIICWMVGLGGGALFGSATQPSKQELDEQRRQSNISAGEGTFRQQQHEQQVEHNLYRSDHYSRNEQPTYHRDRVRDSQQGYDKGEDRSR